MEQVSLTIEGRTARVALDRPERHNALTSAMLGSLVEACSTISDSGADVVVLSAAGDDFSVGFDLEEIASGESDGAEMGGRAVESLLDLEAITVARLSGWVVGGGAALAAACDLRVGDPTVRIRIPEVPLGIPLGWGAVPLLVAELGPALTRDLVMTGRDMDAGEATGRGFLNRLAPAGGLGEEIETLVGRLLEVPAGPLRATKVQVAEAAAILRTAEADRRRLLEAVRSPDFLRVFERYRDGLDRGT
jgi:enoyl-CoA hydratase/carnithine racemase